MTRSIYVIKSEPGPVKVGITSSVQTRLSQLRTGAPYPLSIAYASRAACDIEALESRVHELLSEHRTTGEWFQVEPKQAILAVIQAADEIGVDLSDLDLAPEPQRENRNSAISVRVPDETKQAVEKAASDDGRSVASYVERVLAAHLRDHGYLKPTE